MIGVNDDALPVCSVPVVTAITSRTDTTTVPTDTRDNGDDIVCKDAMSTMTATSVSNASMQIVQVTLNMGERESFENMSNDDAVKALREIDPAASVPSLSPLSKCWSGGQSLPHLSEMMERFGRLIRHAAGQQTIRLEGDKSVPGMEREADETHDHHSDVPHRQMCVTTSGLEV
ncbi:hypothetical protein GBAR_LOCUS25548 [Geodia barretti]|uniref:Uncharacterized protein n=1 Tax=Geodia barretti TaxID=519541 RepID=A0AA35XCC0_GEOBA|nr:hypothetical protein GBAR_LOCUS25548 [Geodia barretti]